MNLDRFDLPQAERLGLKKVALVQP
jgi:hypothetical protein